MNQPYIGYRGAVKPESIDVNGHMNATHFGLVIYEAHAAHSEWLGFNEEYVERARCGKAVLESHMRYEREAGLGDQLGFDVDTPWRKLPAKARRAILEGCDEQVHVRYKNRYGRTRSYYADFEGVLAFLQRRMEQTDSEQMKERLEGFMRDVPCPECQGTRLKPERRCLFSSTQWVSVFQRHIHRKRGAPAQGAPRSREKSLDGDVVDHPDGHILPRLVDDVLVVLVDSVVDGRTRNHRHDVRLGERRAGTVLHDHTVAAGLQFGDRLSSVVAGVRQRGGRRSQTQNQGRKPCAHCSRAGGDELLRHTGGAPFFPHRSRGAICDVLTQSSDQLSYTPGFPDLLVETTREK